MDFFLFVKVGLLVSIALVGWVAGKKLSLSARDISAVLVYVISPCVIFFSIVQSPADFAFFRYSVASFLVSSLLAGLAWCLAGFVWSDSRRNLFSFAAGTGNTGYFALPLIFALFSEKTAAVAVFMIIGVNLYEFSVGYFVGAKGRFDNRECLRKLFSLPVLYAAAAGLAFKSMAVPLHDSVEDLSDHFRGAYSVLGMMVIGMTLSTFSRFRCDWKFCSLALLWKHMAVPLLAMGCVQWLGVNDDLARVAVVLLAAPMAANVVVIANQLDVHPEIAASTVMASTLLAIVSVPVTMHWLLRVL